MWPFRSRKSKQMAAKGLMCQQLVELLTDYLDGALAPAVHQSVAGHLAECPHCSEYMAQFRTTILATGCLRVEDVPEAAMNDLLDVFRGWSG